MHLKSRHSMFLQGLLRAALFISGTAVLVSTAGCDRITKSQGNKTVVNVDGQELKAGDFADSLASRLKHFDALSAKDPMVVTRAKNDIVRDFIIEVLTDNWSKANNVFVRKEDLDTEVALVRKGYPDDLTFERLLTEQNLSYKDWRGQLAKNLLQKLVIKRLKEALANPTEEELKNFYAANKETFERPEQVHIRQIVLATEADARNISDEIKKGKSMAELAIKFSITPDGKKGGDLGWVEKGVMEGFDSAFSMKVGQRSAVIKSPYGYHIFEVLGKRPGTTRPFDEVRNKIRDRLNANREQAAYTSWLESQLRKARVLKDEELISKIKIETKGS